MGFEHVLDFERLDELLDFGVQKEAREFGGERFEPKRLPSER